MQRRVLLGLMCLAQGHNRVTSVRLETAAPWSRVKHSTTEHPLAVRFTQSPYNKPWLWDIEIGNPGKAFFSIICIQSLRSEENLG